MEPLISKLLYGTDSNTNAHRDLNSTFLQGVQGPRVQFSCPHPAYLDPQLDRAQI